jgi:carboxylesterase type B
MYIYLREGKVVKIEKDSSKLNWNYAHTPEGKVQYTPRKNSTNWEYCEYAETLEELVIQVNVYNQEKLDELEQKANVLRAAMEQKKTEILASQK